MIGYVKVAVAVGVAGAVLGGPAAAQRASQLQTENRIENQVAVFAALDKVTARISRLEVPLGESVKFGALTVTPRVCYSRSPLEAPKTSTFVEVKEKQLDGQEKRIFGGWMFAESPGLNAVEHPVYDVWLTECAKPKVVLAAPSGKATPAPQQKAGTPAGGSKAAPSTGTASAPPVGNAPPPQAPGAPADPAADDLKRRRPPR